MANRALVEEMGQLGLVSPADLLRRPRGRQMVDAAELGPQW
jgi:hypothetical protein